MNLSKEDMFCEAKSTSTTASYSDILDFHQHGDDIQNKLFWFILVLTAAADASLAVTWETSDYETFADGSGNASKTDLWTKTYAAAALTADTYVLRNEVLPKGLKRYNRLKFACTDGTDSSVATKAYPTITSALIDGRDEGTPFRG